MRFLLIAGALWLVVQITRGLPPQTRARLKTWTLMVAGVGLAGLLFLRFGFHWLTVSAAVVVPVVRRGWPWLLRGYQAWRLLNRQRGAQSFSSTEENDSSRQRPSPRTGMTRQQALEVLGLTEPASQKDIETAYRELIKRVHPDRGGSQYLAAKLNQARKTLLG